MIQRCSFLNKRDEMLPVWCAPNKLALTCRKDAEYSTINLVQSPDSREDFNTCNFSFFKHIYFKLSSQVFTPGQAARMRLQWMRFRAQPPLQGFGLEDKYPPAPQQLRFG